MAHEVVNGANGSVTWCSGLGCPRCEADRELNERTLRGESTMFVISPGHSVSIPAGSYIRIGC